MCTYHVVLKQVVHLESPMPCQQSDPMEHQLILQPHQLHIVYVVQLHTKYYMNVNIKECHACNSDIIIICTYIHTLQHLHLAIHIHYNKILVTVMVLSTMLALRSCTLRGIMC